MIRTFVNLAALSVLVVSGINACGSDDTRCVDLCEVQEKTQGDVCTEASAEACLEACGDKIGGVEASCGNCLLEESTFNPVEGTAIEPECKSGPECLSGFHCVLAKDGQTCDYCEGDVAKKDECIAQLNPLKEIECPTTFTDASKCTAECGS